MSTTINPDLLARATELFDGDTTTAMIWLMQPAIGLNGLAPAELAATGPDGLEQALNLIGRLEHGVVT